MALRFGKKVSTILIKFIQSYLTLSDALYYNYKILRTIIKIIYNNILKEYEENCDAL